MDAPKQKLSQCFMIHEKESQEMVQGHTNWVQRYNTEIEGADWSSYHDLHNVTYNPGF